MADTQTQNIFDTDWHMADPCCLCNHIFIRAQVNSYKDSDHQGLLELIIDDIQNESSEAESDPQIPIQSNQPVIQVEQIKINDSIVTDTIRTEYF